MARKDVANAKRCQVGWATVNGKRVYQVYNKVLGKGKPPKFVPREKVLDTIDELLATHESQNNSVDKI